MSVILIFGFVAFAMVTAADAKGPCHFDGHTYMEGETIMIAKCLATMECLGDENYGNMVQLGGICPEKREVDGQSGCLFDGRVYGKGDKIMIKPCLAEMTCDGKNVYKDMKSLGGKCPSKRRSLEQVGCTFDGRDYGVGETVRIPSCLGEMACLGRNNYSPITLLSGVCPEQENRRAAVDGQIGCLFDGREYAAGEVITVGDCLSRFTCLGDYRLSQITMLGGVC